MRAFYPGHDIAPVVVVLDERATEADARARAPLNTNRGDAERFANAVRTFNAVAGEAKFVEQIRAESVNPTGLIGIHLTFATTSQSWAVDDVGVFRTSVDVAAVDAIIAIAQVLVVGDHRPRRILHYTLDGAVELRPDGAGKQKYGSKYSPYLVPHVFLLFVGLENYLPVVTINVFRIGE